MVPRPAYRRTDNLALKAQGFAHLHLAHVRHSRPEWPLPPLNVQCERLIDGVARFHAFRWERPRLGGGIGELPGDEFVRRHYDGLAEAWSGFADFLDDRLSAERRRLYEGVLSSWPKMWLQRRGRFTHATDITLIHGDLHGCNILFPQSPRQDGVYLIDWENWRVSVGTDDLAYLMTLHWSRGGGNGLKSSCSGAITRIC